MPRKQLIKCPTFPYHITNRSNNRDFFYIDLISLWGIFISCFKELKKQYSCNIHGFVLMSNHYHLLISTPKSNIGEAMKYLHREVARHTNQETKRINHVFGGRYKWSIIYSDHYYWNAIKYIFRNPVHAGICNMVEDYPFSSLNKKNDYNWIMNDFFNNPNKTINPNLEWLNDPFTIDQEQGIKLALRRRVFELPKNSKRKSIKLDKVQLS